MRDSERMSELMELHAELMGHDFVQDPDDIPGGCLSCWERLSDWGGVDRAWDTKREQDMLADLED